MTEVIKENNPESIQKAASVLREGGIIIYPTETLYGIGALAINEESVKRIFDIKERFYGKPIPILVKDREMFSQFVEVTDEASKLIDRFLPGPLTLVLMQKRSLPEIISAGTRKVAVRISNRPFVRRLFELISEPLTSTSANISGEENLFNFDEIYGTFKGRVDLIVDSGNLPPSKGSTVIDLTVKPPRIVREGDISTGALKEFVKV